MRLIPNAFKLKRFLSRFIESLVLLRLLTWITSGPPAAMLAQTIGDDGLIRTVDKRADVQPTGEAPTEPSDAVLRLGAKNRDLIEIDCLELNQSSSLGSVKDWQKDALPSLTLTAADYRAVQNNFYNKQSNTEFVGTSESAKHEDRTESTQGNFMGTSGGLSQGSISGSKRRLVLNSAGLTELDKILGEKPTLPLVDSSFFVSQEVGSHDFYRTTFGASGPVTRSGNLLYHFSVGYGHGNGYDNYNELENTFVDSGFTWLPTPGLRIDFDFYYSEYKE